MDNKTIVSILGLIRPGAEYNVRGGTIEWLDKVQVQPTDAEMLEGAQTLASFLKLPAVQNQLNAIWKQFATQTLIPEVAAVLSQVQTVNNQVPIVNGTPLDTTPQ